MSLQQTQEKVTQALHSLSPFLKRDGGDVELVRIDEKYVVYVAFKGNCLSCPMSVTTFRNGIANAVKQAAPEITGIEAVNVTSAEGKTLRENFVISF